jgi:hypothetical protein
MFWKSRHSLAASAGELYSSPPLTIRPRPMLADSANLLASTADEQALDLQNSLPAVTRTAQRSKHRQLGGA